MSMKIIFMDTIFDEVKEVLKWDGKEKMCYLLCHSSKCEDDVKLMPYLVIAPGENDYVKRSAGYYEVDKKFVSKAFNKAIEEKADVIQAHIHPIGARGRFSIVDKHDEPIIMKHIADNIKGVYHASIVFSNLFEELDSWFWDREQEQLVPVKQVVIVGKKSMKVFVSTGDKENTCVSKEFDYINTRFDRTVKAFGKEAVEILQYLDVGVVGASALGGPILEMIARDNFRSVTICDPDTIDVTNLNRLPGTSLEDVGKLKAEFYAGYIKHINPDIRVKVFIKNFYEEEVQLAFSQVDIIIGCLDSGARFSINTLASANIIPYFDLGAGILVEKGKLEYKGGQVFSIIPSCNVCLECSGVYGNLREQFWSPEKKERELKQGYINDTEVMNPLVTHLDYVIAGLGYHEMISYVWGQKKDVHFARYCNLADGTMIKILIAKSLNSHKAISIDIDSVTASNLSFLVIISSCS